MNYRDNLSEYIKNLIKETNNDPRLLNQFVYKEDVEANDLINTVEDVANDKEINKVKGIYHRYPGKILIFPTEKCLGSCRFCFRKNIISDEGQDLSLEDFKAIEEYIIKENIEEVIFSGGDPFAIKQELLLEMIKCIKKINQVHIIRIHTRVLTYAPNLITQKFVEEIKEGTPVFFVFHINSHLEVTNIAKQKLNLLTSNGILCFAQTALLKGVNNTEQDLRMLFTTLIENKVKPYYLFHPDRVKGTGHFYLPLKEGIELYNSLYNRISGLAMPIYLFNVPNGYGHCIVDLNNIIKTEKEGHYIINTWEGESLHYEDVEFENRV